MTDDAKALLTAKNILFNKVHYRDFGGPLEQCYFTLAETFLALSEKCRRYEAAMREVPHENWCDTLNNLGEHCNCNISPIFEALEPGDSDG